MVPTAANVRSVIVTGDCEIVGERDLDELLTFLRWNNV